MDLKARRERIKTIATELKDRITESEKTLSELRAKTPLLMARHFLGESEPGEVIEHKGRILELRALIEDATAALEGLALLNAENSKLLEREAKVETQRKSLERYESLKPQVFILGNEKTYSRQLEQDFRQAAAAIGQREEAAAILHNLQRQRDHRRPVAK